MYIISRTMELGSPQNQNKDGLLGSNSIVVVYYIHIYYVYARSGIENDYAYAELCPCRCTYIGTTLRPKYILFGYHGPLGKDEFRVV